MKRFLLVLTVLTVLLVGCLRTDGQRVPPQDGPKEPEEKTAVEQLLAEMTLEEKIGQLLMVGMEGTELDEETARFLRNHKIGGVILFGRNMKNHEQIRELTGQLQNLASGPAGVALLIGTDQEGGRVNRLPGEKGRFPSARSMAGSGDPDRVRDTAARMAVQLKELGINMNFAPVLDINSNPQSTVIGDRAFGNNPETVTTMGLAFIEGTLAEGIIPVAKHFPGYGNAALDPHTNLPAVTQSLEALQGSALIPFQEAVAKDVPAIMTAHILLPQVDAAAPATLSRTIITGILREQLQFDGVIVSDDLDMGAITELYSPGEAAVLSLQSGVDLLLVCHNRESMTQAFEELVAAVQRGEISGEELDQKVSRILALKEKYGLIDRDG